MLHVHYLVILKTEVEKKKKIKKKQRTGTFGENQVISNLTACSALYLCMVQSNVFLHRVICTNDNEIMNLTCHHETTGTFEENQVISRVYSKYIFPLNDSLNNFK